jgi:hypothetical protein
LDNQRLVINPIKTAECGIYIEIRNFFCGCGSGVNKPEFDTAGCDVCECDMPAIGRPSGRCNPGTGRKPDGKLLSVRNIFQRQTNGILLAMLCIIFRIYSDAGKPQHRLCQF